MVKYVKMQSNKNLKSGFKPSIFLACLGLLFWVISGLLWSTSAYAALDCSAGNQHRLAPAEKAQCAIQQTDPDGQTRDSQQTVNQTLAEVLNILKYVIGVASVVVILVQSFRLIVSGGNPKEAVKARNGILYALVGILLALMAPTLILFVIERFQG